MVPIGIGIVLAFISMVGALGVVVNVPLSRFPTIADACLADGLKESVCSSNAWNIGVQSAIAYALVLAAGLALYRFSPWRNDTPVPKPDPVATTAVLLVSFGLLFSHMVALWIGPVHASRLDESAYFSNYISLENLLWPLLLQLYVTGSDERHRVMLLCALLVVMAYTPYRGVLFAILVFGFMVPLAMQLWRAKRGGWLKGEVAKLAQHGALAAVIALVTAWGAYVDTATRAPSLVFAAQIQAERQAEPVQSAIAEPSRGPVRSGPEIVSPPVPATEPAFPAQVSRAQARTSVENRRDPALQQSYALSERILQRVAFPLYQAAIAENLAGLKELPTIWDELARKFRLSNAPAREEFLFRRIYGGEGRGETTSLSYGEAVAYFPGPAIFWMVVIPLGVLGIGLLLRRYDVDAGTVLGVGVWRSSFSGFIPVLPAMTLQVLGLMALTWIGRLLARGDRSGRILRPAMNATLMVLLGGVLVAHCGMLLQKQTRHTVLIASFSTSTGCVLESPTWVPIRVNQVLADHRLSISSAMIWSSRNSATVGVPYARQSNALLAEMATRIGTLVRCTPQEIAAPVTLTSTRILPWTPNPLDLMAVLSMVVALLAGLGGVTYFRSGRFRLWGTSGQ